MNSWIMDELAARLGSYLKMLKANGNRAEPQPRTQCQLPEILVQDLVQGVEYRSIPPGVGF